MFNIENFYKRPLKKIGDKYATSYVTIVAMFYKFPSKHSSNEYTKWTNNFLSSVSSPIVIFTDTESYNRLKEIGERLKLSITFYVTNSIWDIVDDIGNWRGINYIDNYLNKQHGLDPEKNIHNPNLYAVWNSKHYILKLVTELNPYSSEFFIYTDMGAWRQEVLVGWPDVDFVKQVSSVLQGKALYGQVNNVNEEKINIKANAIEGTFFAGSKNAIQNLAKAFYDIHDDWLNKGDFVGKDQSMMNELAYKQYSYLIKRLMSWDRRCKKPNDVWFFYQVFFAHLNQYYCHEDRLSLIK